MDRPSTYWSAKAQEKLNESRYWKSARLQQRTQWTGLTTLVNEADVVYASAQYLISPIESILNIEYGDRIRISSEKPGKSGKIGEGHIRMDLVFHRPEKEQTIAILEYKRRGFLQRRDFQGAFTSSNVGLGEKLSRAANDPLLKDNAFVSSKQAAAYAIDTQTPFVAIFDWDTMVLFEFNNLKDDNVGEVAFGTWVDENGRETFRKVLLGWVLKACQARDVPRQ
ncbi:hypothetical protein K505DRAFT_254126 [Melanomma pulvis-pyrius CBS 109.77]|uniref:Uncharacterized protein n=1 Tax=Melanomma pulvis-pyrius CBS 109.77 TaxID=1314802 RepID=A0A6A6WYA6_9PLEO|nr:hypothetical protein K505DRAFT_254126 [Melanomma pulvis-pyrius CBS 109.77]